jgi:hypothetical protein
MHAVECSFYDHKYVAARSAVPKMDRTLGNLGSITDYRVSQTGPVEGLHVWTNKSNTAETFAPTSLEGNANAEIERKAKRQVC